MNFVRIVFLVIFVMTSVESLSAQDGSVSSRKTSATTADDICTSDLLPVAIQRRIRQDFGTFAIQVPSLLSSSASKRWRAEEPLSCPGIVVGRFEGNVTSYAILLVARNGPDSVYKLVVFSRKTGKLAYEPAIIEQESVRTTANLFIHNVRISKFFGEAARKKFQAKSIDGILLADAGENEYQTDVYFWTGSSYRHEPVDY